MNEADRRRQEIRDLVLAHGRGDLPERPFQKQLAERTVDLYREVVRSRLSGGETILQEHHVIRTHTRLTQSVLRSAPQEAVSLFLTDRRLLQLRSTFEPGRAVTADAEDQTVVNAVPFCDIIGVRTRREIRTGEIAAGAVIAAFAFLFRHELLVTGPLMIGLGVLGVLHGLLLPTAWREVETIRGGGDAPIRIYAARKKSARLLVERLEGFLAGAPPPRGPGGREGDARAFPETGPLGDGPAGPRRREGPADLPGDHRDPEGTPG